MYSIYFTLSVPECLEPFTTIGMSCYIIKRHGLASWGDAQNWCDGMGAYLIKIDNEDEDQAIDKRLSKYLHT